MDNPAYKSRNFQFTRQTRPNDSRRVHPDDQENNPISIHSADSNPSSRPAPRSDDTLLNSNKFGTRRKKISSKKNTSISIKGLLITGGIILFISCAIIIPTVLVVYFSRNPSVTAPTTTSTIAPTVYTAYWSLDRNANDLYGIYNGVLVNGATYSNTTYFGFGSNLYLNASINQSMTVASPYFNLSYTSFTVEAWIYGYSFSGDNPIFSQCQCSTCQDECLYLIIRNYKLYMGFTVDDLIGLTTLSINTWYHVAYVYDYSSYTQSVYLQGILDNSKSSAGPYQGQNASMRIGSSQLASGSFNGLIDNVRVTTRAKSASEVLTDATMVVYFSFDGSTPGQDMGPNEMNGTVSNANTVTGRVGQGLAFSGTAASYLQIYGFYQLGQSNQPFSFSLWIYPYSVTGGTLIQKSQYSNSSGWCYNFMGIDYLGQISMVVYNSYQPVIIGPVLSVRAWTHLGYTYSTTNGIKMYINGVLVGTTGPASWLSSGTIDWLSVGSYVSGYCGTGSGAVYAVPYLGVIDEFYVFRRELAASEVSTLANP